jgi:hypothetical protein
MRILFISLLLAAAPKVNAQLGQYYQGHIFAKYSYGIVDSANYHNYSISGEYFVNPYIGLNYNFDLMFRSDGLRQFHTSIGALAGPPLILIGIVSAASNDDDDLNSSFNLGPLGIALGILILAAPDGVSFHIPLSYKWDLSPYVNVLGLDYVRNRNTGDHKFKYAMSFGVKGSYLVVDRFTFSTFVETRKVAGMGWSLGGGFGLGIALGERSEDEDNSDFIELP